MKIYSTYENFSVTGFLIRTPIFTERFILIFEKRKKNRE